MKNLISVLVTLVMLSGCASVKYNGATTNHRNVSYPTVGEVTTAYIGDRLVEKGQIYEVSYLRVRKSIEGVLYTIPEGDYDQLGHDESNYYYSATGVTKSVLAYPFKALAQPRNSVSEICVVTTWGATNCYDGKIERSMRSKASQDSFQQTLLYSGRVGNKINVSYREFSSSMARPAFNNDVEYDLDDSNIIGYKGALIEVLDADNQSITYKLIKNFPN